MKFTQVPIILALLVPAIAAMPAGETVDAAKKAEGEILAQACGAEGSCEGIGGGDLCNDRCKKCKGPSGYYSSGECGGLGWQTCQCFYD